MISDLSEIGFKTLSNQRAAQASATSPLWRCELLITKRCNFACPYCRHVGEEISTQRALSIISDWAGHGLKNIRFSGGEPTLHRGLGEMVRHAASLGVTGIAVSTNGSADWATYDVLIDCGVNDFSVSLDACCASTGDAMAGRTGAWAGVPENIQRMAGRGVYVTAGVVVTDDNSADLAGIISFASSLGVRDVRVIPAAQSCSDVVVGVNHGVLSAHPILRYRMNMNRRLRGLDDTDSRVCALVLDDVAASGGHHYPCIIYLREGGAPIGKIGPSMRDERAEWSRSHDSHIDPICSLNCLDVCAEYNNKHAEFHADSPP